MRRRWRYLIAAVVLLGIAAWLMRGSEPPEEPPARVEMPRRFTGEDYRRMVKRQTLPELPRKSDLGPPPRPRDPLLAALPSGKGKTAVVFEANAIRNSPVGQLLLDCLARDRGGNPVDEIKRKVNVDFTRDLDRVAITSEGAVLSGNFQNATWGAVNPRQGDFPSQSYGDQGTLYTTQAGPNGSAAAAWGGQLFYVGENQAEAQGAIDRVEGRSTDVAPISENESYGEVYGEVSVADLVKLLPADQQDLAQKLAAVASSVELHVDTRQDVGITATVQGTDRAGLNDLAKSLGGLLSLARLKAAAEGDHDLADLLELAKVDPASGRFNVELALPMKLLEQKLAWCRAPLDGGTPAH